MLVSMQMSLDFGHDMDCFLFEGWGVHSGAAYFGTALFTMTLAFIIETIPYIRSHLKSNNEETHSRANNINKSEITN